MTIPTEQIPIEQIITELSRPEAYPYPVDKVEIIQTHISVVFLAGDKVYKVKKPVDFGFLDFTTLEKRKHFCEEELRLNRRLSPGTYLDVVPVLKDVDGLKFGEIGLLAETGPGVETAVEYAVVMERLDENRMLSELLARGEVDASMMDTIARRIAEFHHEAETSPYITNIGGTRAVKFNTEEDFQQIEPYIGRTLDRATFERIVEFTRTFIEVNIELFTAREKNGWIRDGHGDLHSQHICLGSEAGEIKVFDCIEFNERFRFGDVLVDAAFLAMDLERLGFNELAARYTKTYLGNMDQEEQTALFNFYACYRAVVRGKVEGFRSSDPNIKEEKATAARESARTFHQLAERYARTITPPILIAGCGLMGSGKSTLARSLAKLVDIKVLSSDTIRKSLAGIDPIDKRHVPFGQDIYSGKHTEGTYLAMHEQAHLLLENGQSVFLDASYMDPGMRARAAETALQSNARFLLVYMEGDEEILRSRLRARKNEKGVISDGREEILAEQMAAFVAPDEFQPDELLTLDSTRPTEDFVQKVYRRLLSSN